MEKVFQENKILSSNLDFVASVTDFRVKLKVKPTDSK